ncbi:MAG: BadF/BadG/BcrA/BcrD ATPase family protein [Pyrinomonadaceae bacterium]
MKARHQPPARETAPNKLSAHALTLGVDGGGTKTQAIIADEKGRVVGEGLAGASNPLRVGVSQAAAAVREAFHRALDDAGARRSEVAAAEVGLAGVRREDLRDRMRDELASLGVGAVEVVTDAEIALYGATNGEPGLILISGTGSICCGKNARGRHTCAGGWGPIVGDEGSGSWIARRALVAVARATDGRGRPTALVAPCLEYFKIATAEDLSTAIYAPSLTNERIAGFARLVVETAKGDDEVAHEILRAAGRELARAAVAVIQKLRMEREEFQVAYVGGVFKAGALILNPMREEITRVAPRARLSPPQLPPALAAARMARAQLPALALAG